MRVKLDKVCKRIYAGGDVPKDRYSTVKTAEYAIPIYANAEKDNGLYGYTDTARENELSITVAARGTIGFTAIRREPFLPVVRLITVVPDLSTVSERYLYYALRNCKPAFSGTSIPQLTVPDIKKNEIELYSLSVQETIADKLDAVGRIIELRQQQLQKLDELVKARFVELFSGTYKEVSTEDICSEIVDCPHSTPKYDEDNLIYPAIRTSEIQNGSISWNSMKYVGAVEYENRIKRLKPVGGDVVYAREGTYGDCVILPNEYEFCLGQRTMLFRPNYRICTSAYLHAALRSDAVRKQADESNAGSTVPHVNVADAKKFHFPLPPLELQNQFAAFVEQVDKSKVAVQKSLDEAQLLFDSLMQQYFE